MYRRVKKIPSILGILIIFAGLGAAIYLDRFSQSGMTSAKESLAPTEVHFTNITDNSITVSWLTKSLTTGAVKIKVDSQQFTYLDDLDSDNIQRPRITHQVTLKNLKEESSYELNIISGSGGCPNTVVCPNFRQKTGKKLDDKVDLPPLHGTIVHKDDKTAETTIVYLIMEHASPLSGRVDTAGLWVIPFNNLRSADLLSRPQLTDDTIVQIAAYASPTDTTTGVIDIKSIRQNLTVPKMQIGNSYNFINLLSKTDLLAKTGSDYILGDTSYINPKTVQPTPDGKNSLDILFPKKNNDSTSDRRPRIRGIGTPGQSLLITVNSAPQTAKVTVARDGTWVFRPVKELSPGVHHIKVNGYDNKGKLISVNRSFIVLKSGEAVLGDSTPSATLSPTETPAVSPTTTPLVPTPSPTITPTLTPTSTPEPTIFPSATISVTPPRSGDTTPTLALALGGLVMIAAGIKFLLFP